MNHKEDPFCSSFALDIGGSLAKVAFLHQGFIETSKIDIDFSKLKKEINFIENNTNFKLKMKSGEVVDFIEFPTECIPEFIEWIKKEKILDRKEKGSEIKSVFGCGGGIKKYKDLIEKQTGCKVECRDEIQSLVSGLNFLIGGGRSYFIDSSLFRFKNNVKQFIEPISDMNSFFPYIFVNIGSGISIVKVSSKTEYKRITGSPLGGATFIGLLKLFLRKDEIDFPVVMENISSGDYRNVDLLVGDIYGFGNSTTSNLSSNLVASSFGKIATNKVSVEKVNEKDLMSSLIYMIGINISQIVCLTAKIHNVKNIIFSGGFMRKNQDIWKYLDAAVEYWGHQLNVKMETYFVKHHKFSGCLGCLLKENVI